MTATWASSTTTWADAGWAWDGTEGPFDEIHADSRATVAEWTLT